MYLPQPETPRSSGQSSTKQPIANVTNTGLDVALVVKPVIDTAREDLGALGPHVGHGLETAPAAEEGEYGDVADAPVSERKTQTKRLAKVPKKVNCLNKRERYVLTSECQ